VSAWIAQLCHRPPSTALAVPEVPLTEVGGVACPSAFKPQQTAFPVPAWIAQTWESPTPIELAVPEVPLTEAGGVDWSSAHVKTGKTWAEVATTLPEDYNDKKK